MTLRIFVGLLLLLIGAWLLRRHRRGPAVRIYFILKGQRVMEAFLNVGQLIRPSLDIRDRGGNPAPVDGVPVWTSNFPTSVLEVAPDGMSAIFRGREVFVGTLTVTADADLGAGVIQIVSVLDVTIRPAQASVINFIVPPAEEDPTF